MQFFFLGKDAKGKFVCGCVCCFWTMLLDLHEPLNNTHPPPPSMAPPPYVGEDFSFGSRAKFPNEATTPCAGEKQRQSVSKSSNGPHSPPPPPPKMLPEEGKPKEMPHASVLAKLILRMVGRKLLQNPNTYSSLLGLVWSLISFK